MIEGWHDSLESSIQDATLQSFLSGKGVVDTIAEFASEVKSSGKAMMGNAMTGYYSSSKIIPFFNSKYKPALAEKGIKAVMSKITVNLGQKNYREFLWVELIDEAVAGDYVAGQAM